MALPGLMRAQDPLLATTSGDHQAGGWFCCCRPTARWRFAVWAWIGLILDYGLRVSMSVAAEKPSAAKRAAGSSTATMYTDFNWDDLEQGYVLSSFYIGYTISQIPGALFCAANPRIGPRKTVMWGLGGAAVFSLLTPVVAAARLELLVVVRALCGLCEGVVYPALSVLLLQWAVHTQS